MALKIGVGEGGGRRDAPCYEEAEGVADRDERFFKDHDAHMVHDLHTREGQIGEVGPVLVSQLSLS